MGEKLRIARTSQYPRLRQRDVDELAGVPHGRTAHYENGRAAPPHAFLARIAALWDIPVGWFLDPTTTQPPRSHSDQHEALREGYTPIECRPDLPIGDWSENYEITQTEVEIKFARKEAFASRVSGDFLGPKILHGDLVIFWPSTKLRAGVLSFTHPTGEDPKLVVPVLDPRTEKMVLHLPGSRSPLHGEGRIEAYAVGAIRQVSEGDTLTLFNPSGIRYSLF